MAQQLKRWESPRRKGRNRKGRGGSAKHRQYKKRQKLLMKRLQSGISGSSVTANDNKSNKKGEAHRASPFLLKAIRMRGLTPCLY